MSHPPRHEVPAFPALCRGLARVESPGGLVIEGGPHRMLLGGASTEFVARLLPLLDGRHDHAALCARLDVEPARLRQALELIGDWGVLESGGPGSTADPPVSDDVVAYFSRTINTMDGHGSAEDLLAALAAASVLLVTGEQLGGPLAEDLAAGGVGTVAVAEAAADGARPTSAGDMAPGTGLVVALDTPDSPARLAALVVSAHAVGVPVLRAACRADAVEVGPLFWPGQSACVGCFRRGDAAWDPGPVPGIAPDEAAMGLLTALTTSEVLAVLGGTTPPATSSAVVRVTVASHTTERRLLTPDTGCARCGDGTAAADPGPAATARSVDAYEWQQALPPRELAATVRMTAPRRRQLRKALDRRTVLPTSPARALPAAPDPHENVRANPPAGIAGLLRRTAGLDGAEAGRSVGTSEARRAGVTGGTGPSAGVDAAGIERRLPSQGGLACVELYVLAEPSLFGLPGSVFTYDDVGHRVFSVRADILPWRAALARAGLDGEETEAAVVVVADIGRLHTVCGDSAWRTAHLEAGVAAMQLVVAARGSGIHVTFTADWDSDLPEWLEIDPEREAVTAVAALSRDSWARPTAQETLR
ncbi:hypothetical protein OG949_37140 [Streptomyces scopuliridis]|uniref:hypothetical protein n=1 Tax=Streptomyces scopuliridis TaxID=452529 RepID=UPI002DD7FFBA|nr:hypothetical protein [Streptomyces scopuliridis]WSB37905.1 hypothetical protein OG949_37140 [Streptomyces scopuliridis]